MLFTVLELLGENKLEYVEAAVANPECKKRKKKFSFGRVKVKCVGVKKFQLVVMTTGGNNQMAESIISLVHLSCAYRNGIIVIGL